MIKSLFTIITALAFIIVQVNFLSEVGCLVTKSERDVPCAKRAHIEETLLRVEWE